MAFEFLDDPKWVAAIRARWHTYSPSRQRSITHMAEQRLLEREELQAAAARETDARLTNVERQLNSISSGGARSSGGQQGGARAGAGRPTTTPRT
jgi:hypothetical protein